MSHEMTHMFYQKLYGTKIVNLFKTNFAFLRFFRISHIIVKKNCILDFQ